MGEVSQEQLDQTLLKSSELGLLEEVKKCLKSGANIEAADKDGVTPLCLAVGEGHLDVVNLLISSGAKVDVIDGSGFGLLHWAAYANEKASLELIELLVRKFQLDLNTKDSAQGWTPLIAAINTKGLSLTTLLLRLGADVNLPDLLGWTPLHHAAFRQRIEIVRELLKNGADKNQKNNKSRSAKDLAEDQLKNALSISEML